MAKSENIGQPAAALSKAQGAIKGAIKDSANPFFKSSYADLASVWDAARAPLAANGLAVVQTTELPGDGGAVLVTTLCHESGEWIDGMLPIRPVKDDPQGMGSAITYMRRYALAAIVGIAPEDDDGNAASGRVQGINGNGHKQQPPRQREPQEAPAAPPHNGDNIFAEINALERKAYGIPVAWCNAREKYLGKASFEGVERAKLEAYMGHMLDKLAAATTA